VSLEIAIRPWADLVFHVLAHVPSPTPASLFDPAYVAFAARHIGAANARALGEDARVLARFATDHGRYTALQGLAWLFSSLEQEERHHDHELVALDGGGVADSTLLEELRALGPEVEVLRCGAELEAEAHARLPPITTDTAALAKALDHVGRAAPALVTFRIGLVRSLRLRGRVRANEIWVGAPSEEPGPELAHAAWQAAHEATVSELTQTRAADTRDDRPLERAALVLLAERAARAGLRSEHGTWFAHFGLPRTVLEPASLTDPWRDTVHALVAGSRDRRA
jgi:hypothetical protein